MSMCQASDYWLNHSVYITLKSKEHLYTSANIVRIKSASHQISSRYAQGTISGYQNLLNWSQEGITWMLDFWILTLLPFPNETQIYI